MSFSGVINTDEIHTLNPINIEVLSFKNSETQKLAAAISLFIFLLI